MERRQWNAMPYSDNCCKDCVDRCVGCREDCVKWAEHEKAKEKKYTENRLRNEGRPNGDAFFAHTVAKHSQGRVTSDQAYYKSERMKKAFKQGWDHR